VNKGYDYSRSINPTRVALEGNLAGLEGGRHGLAFSSGLGAANTVLDLLSSGDHVVAGNDLYGGSYRIMRRVFERFGMTFTFADTTDVAKTREAFRPNTKLLWIETPSNPLLRITDIAACASLAKERGALTIVDNTFATPVLTNPLALGADVVSHSCTKYIGGHSDVIGGALICTDDALADRLRFTQNAVGAIAAPWDSFLLLRSTKTLHVRVQRHCENAAKIADFLAEQKQIERVVYPGRTDHPQHEIAKKQMTGGYGGMITAYFKGGLEPARTFLERVKLFSLAESLGGVESLIEHPAIMTHASVDKHLREQIGLTDGLVRFSVGIEDVEDLIADIQEALG
jgi:cystathionine beta-lyase/cystathionine gamma-synthase